MVAAGLTFVELERCMITDALQRIAMLATGLVLPTGCCPQYDCASSNMLMVQDANGRVLKERDGLVAQTSGTLTACLETEACTYKFYGALEFTLSYAGHKPVTARVTDAKDDCGNYVNQTVTLKLVRETAAETAAPKSVQGASCGG
jgi:hypothetical protein